MRIGDGAQFKIPNPQILKINFNKLIVFYLIKVFYFKFSNNNT